MAKSKQKKEESIDKQLRKLDKLIEQADEADDPQSEQKFRDLRAKLRKKKPKYNMTHLAILIGAALIMSNMLFHLLDIIFPKGKYLALLVYACITIIGWYYMNKQGMDTNFGKF